MLKLHSFVSYIKFILLGFSIKNGVINFKTSPVKIFLSHTRARVCVAFHPCFNPPAPRPPLARQLLRLAARDGALCLGLL